MEELAVHAWTQIRGELTRFVYKRVKDKALAEDIVHDVLLKIYAKAGQLKESDKIFAWIYQITRNAVNDYFRSQSRTFDVRELDFDTNPKDFNDCVAFCLNTLIKTLPQKYREALELTEHQNLSQLELADRLSISYSGAKSRVQRARALLKQKLHDLYRIKTDAYGNVLVCEDKLPCGCDTSPSFEEKVVMPR
jgi:RNA polymerase sigma-70 factor (ECF subfamily)